MDCGLQGKFTLEANLAGTPRTQNAAASWGTVLHHCLEHYHTDWEGDIEEAVNEFHRIWLNPEILGVAPDTWPKRMSYGSLKEMGEEILREFHEQNKWQSKEIIAAEHKFCVAPSTGILTKQGVVPIDQIQVGQEVLTHRGRWRRVTEVVQNRTYGGVVKVEAKGLEPLIVTENHPLHVMRYMSDGGRRPAGVEWVTAGELFPWVRNAQAECHSVTIPRLERNEERVLDVSRLIVPKRTGHSVINGEIKSKAPNGHAVPASLPYSKQLGNIVGTYLAEGHTSGGSAVTWSFHEDETDLCGRLIDDIFDVFGLKATLYKNDGWGKVTKVICHSRFLADILRCGTLASDKKLPEWVWDGPPSFIEAVLQGWIDGDGNVYKEETRGSTTSEDLAWHMWLLALACGKKAIKRKQVRESTCVIEGRTVNQKHIYHVSWRDGTTRPGSYRLEETCLTSPIRSNDSMHYDGMVFNLEVDEDESYLTVSGLVHNCVPVGDHLISGVVDLLSAKHGESKLTITDWKSSGSQPRLDALYLNTQFTTYALASLKEEFWVGFDDGSGKYPPLPDGKNLFERFRNTERELIWYHLRKNKAIPAGPRDDQDFLRLGRVCNEIARALEFEVFVPSISGNSCPWCDFKDACPAWVPPPETTDSYVEVR